MQQENEKLPPTNKSKGGQRRKWPLRIGFLIGFLLICYPFASNILQQKEQREAITTYQSSLNGRDPAEIEQSLRDARAYNNMLYQSKGAIIDHMDTGILSDESYLKLLNQSGSGVMGSLEIPKIDVSLPIYHGTSEEVLSKGAGHQQGTSLPVGGENTHCVLTGHRGLPGSKLFTRLDEIEEGDLFFLKIFGNTFAYRVEEIRIVDPEDTSVLKIDPEKDSCSLITCTPYGLNTHRLVVRAERVDYEKVQYQNIKAEMPSAREIFFVALPFLLLGIVAIQKYRDWRTTKSEKAKEAKEADR